MHILSTLVVAAILASPVFAQAGEYQQCGGQNWGGATSCVSSYVCTVINPYYSQCLPSSSGGGGGGGGTAPPASGGTLKSLASAKGKYFGTAYDPNYNSDSTYGNIVKTQFSILTPENSMKWDATEPSRGSFSFGTADQLVSFATAAGQKVRGHTLVWHNQLPSWVANGGFNNATLISILQNHITSVMTHYKGKIYSWDVVNEALNEDGSIRQDVFYNTIGETYFDIAFKAARAADPNAILGINDYNIEGSGAKSTGMINLVTRLLARGVPIDQIGIQGHFTSGQVSSSIASNWGAFAKLVKQIAITELDIKSNGNANQQATDYSNVVKTCLGISNCAGITVWGASDKYSWISGGSACLWDSNMQPKAAETAVVTALGG